MRVSLKTLKSLPDVPFTKTWRPYSHYDVLTKLHEVAKFEGLKLIHSKYELSKNLHNVYGLLQFESPDSEYHRLLAIRNSTNKSFSLGLCAGCHVIVCSNGCFNGDFKLIHIHDRSLTDERIYGMLLEATKTMIIRSAQTVTWLNGLKEIVLTLNQFKAQTFDMLINNIIPPSKLNKFIHDIVRTNQEVDTPYTAYVLQNAVTRFYKDSPIQLAQSRITKANELINRMV